MVYHLFDKVITEPSEHVEAEGPWPSKFSLEWTKALASGSKERGG